MGPLTDTDPLLYLSYFSWHEEGREKNKEKRKKRGIGLHTDGGFDKEFSRNFV